VSGQLRQGDVLLRPVDQMPASAVRVDVTGEPDWTVVATGEHTGHRHALPARDAQLFATPSRRYLRVLHRTYLGHDEHIAIPVEPGVYEIVLQRTYIPGAIVPVAD